MAFPPGFWLGDSGGDHREHPRAPAHQIAWSTVSFNAASNHRVDHCVLAFPGVLEICAATLFQRQFVNSIPPFVDESGLDRDAALLPHTRDNSRR